MFVITQYVQEIDLNLVTMACITLTFPRIFFLMRCLEAQEKISYSQPGFCTTISG